jgi:hypothetical protein
MKLDSWDRAETTLASEVFSCALYRSRNALSPFEDIPWPIKKLPVVLRSEKKMKTNDDKERMANQVI